MVCIFELKIINFEIIMNFNIPNNFLTSIEANMSQVGFPSCISPGTASEFSNDGRVEGIIVALMFHR